MRSSLKVKQAKRFGAVPDFRKTCEVLKTSQVSYDLFSTLDPFLCF